MNIGRRIAIFDTSAIDGEKNSDSFFGGRNELAKFSAVCEIVIPDMVIDEITKHKKRHLSAAKSKFISNPFRYLLNLEQESIDMVNIDEKINTLQAEETISYTVIKLSKADALERIKNMCHECVAPFGENEDKGFKDAYILLTIEEYLETLTDEQVFVVVKDGKLKEALGRLAGITVVNSFDEFELFSKSQFMEEYFLQRLSETIDEEVGVDAIVSADFNINDNWVLQIDTEEKPTYVEVDFKNREIIGFQKVRIVFGVTSLLNSGSFVTTHEWIEKISDKINYLNTAQMIDLINAATTNDQIYQISSDEDVKEFFFTIFEKVKPLVQADLANIFTERFSYKQV